MRHHLLVKKILSFVLCFAMLLTNSNYILADSESETLTYASDLLKITATAEAGVIPEGVSLSVKEINKGEAYQKIAEDLIEYTIDENSNMIGFLAYDISLVDEDGNEVEPNGPVKVSMKYSTAVSPDGIEDSDNVDINLVHFNEANKQIEIQDITDDSKITTNSDNEVKDISFVTDSFSTFSIYWKDTASLKMHYVDESGNEIAGSKSGNVTFDEDIINFNNYSKDVEGYEFQYARAYGPGNDNHADSAKLTIQRYLYWTGYKIEFLDGRDVVQSTENSSPDVYLVYKKIVVQDPSDKHYETISTKSDITINLFDYKVNTGSSKNETITTPKTKAEGNGINKNHYFKFLSASNEGTPNQNNYSSGYGAHQGVVDNKLGSDGYPKLSSWGEHESLSYLFNSNDIKDAKKAYMGVDKLFYKDKDGYYYYNSDENYATVAPDKNKKEFTVYNQPSQGFFPFTSFGNATNLSPSANGDVLGTDAVNHFFGLTVETDFLQPLDGKIDGKPMVFEFSGDDDVWVFIDDVLVLDIGGIHGKVAGSINFANGEVKVDNAAKNPVSTTIKKLYEAANGSVSDDTFTGETFSDYTTHTMKFFYVERGNYDSNCKLKFNLQTLPKGDLYVSKVATGVEFNDASEYEFVLRDSKGRALANAEYKLNGGTTVYKTDFEGKFRLKKNEYAIFSGLNAGTYTVTECGIKNSEYSLDEFTTKISVNGSESIISIDRTATVDVNDATSSRAEFRNLHDVITENNDEYQKVIKYNADADDYDLTLSFKGPEEKVTSTDTTETVTTTTSKADIVFVVDMSGSMDDDNRLINAKKAISSMTSTIKNNKVDARYKLVTFSEEANILNQNSGWVNSDTFTKWVNNLKDPNGATNYQDALVTGQSAVAASPRSDAEKIVIFVTDGEPTRHLETRNGTVSNSGTYLAGGGYYTDDDDYAGALMGAGALTGCDIFYAVGIGLNETSTVYSTGGFWNRKNYTALDILENVTAAVPANAKVRGAYNSSSTDLATLFKDLAEKIVTDVTTTVTETYHYASAVTITDELSEYADIVDGSEYQIRVVDSNGTEVGKSTIGIINSSDAEYVITVAGKEYKLVGSYDSENKKITLVCPEDYELNSNYTYSITFKVKASAYAYEQYIEEGYNAVGDANTDAVGNDTSSGKDGFRSNTKATVTYKFKGVRHNKTYDHPVIQVRRTYDWNLNKVSASSATVKLEGAEFTLSNDLVTYTGSSDNQGRVIWDADKIEPGTYVLIETKAPVGYKINPIELTVVIDEYNNITITKDNETYEAAETNVIENNGVTNTTYTFNFANEALYSLPSAGGVGIFAYMISGMLMILAGALLIYRRRKSLIC